MGTQVTGIQLPFFEGYRGMTNANQPQIQRFDWEIFAYFAIKSATGARNNTEDFSAFVSLRLNILRVISIFLFLSNYISL